MLARDHKTYHAFIFIALCLLLSTVVSASNLTRKIPSTVDGGKKFTVEYVSASDKQEYFVAWTDNVSGGCTPLVYESFLASTQGGTKTDSQEFTAPSSGSCTFRGKYQFADEELKSIGENTITIGEGCTPVDSKESFACDDDN